MIVQIKIKSNRVPVYVKSNLIELKKNDIVILKYNELEYIGTVNSINIKESVKTNGFIIRKANKKDIKINLSNIAEENKAYKKCLTLIKKYKLEMRLLKACYSFDKKQLLFIYVADKRVDFRDLAKELANIYKTRIELRQIGIRDKASIVSGIGMCGKELCCAKFLKSIDTVSINMAKNQHLTLNPSKINGCCGRLLCCLNYEDEIYKENKKELPEVGEKIKIDNKEGQVISINVLKKSYKVDMGNNDIIEIIKDAEDGSNT